MERNDIRDVARVDGGEEEPKLVVGIGASAGGLEAIQEFFSAVPARTGIAFGVLVHAPAGSDNRLAEYLSHYTPMEVRPAGEGFDFRPDVVLAFSPSAQPDGVAESPGADHSPHSIDRFLESLAGRFGRTAVAVVLSGVGSDGARGAKAVEDAGGVVLVQDPETAVHGSMPMNAAGACSRAEIMPLERMAERLLAAVPAGESPGDPAGDPAERVREVLRIVRARTGNDFSPYKTNTVLRRLERRMKATGAASLSQYLLLLENNAEEVSALSRDFSIRVTSFFRDPEAFDSLRDEVLPVLFRHRTAENPIRVWDACCASGEEAYSLAILLKEYGAAENAAVPTQIFATDFEDGAISVARTGRYPESIASAVSEERLRRFFTRSGAFFHVSKELRESIVFARHNLLSDPPFSRVDLIACRNFLIYLSSDVQQRLLGTFHDMLLPGGFLFLGSSETLGPISGRFSPVEKRWRIFRKVDMSSRPVKTFAPIGPGSGLWGAGGRSRDASRESSPGHRAERILAERYAPPFAVVDESLEVVHFSPRVSKFLQIPEGEPTRNLLQMLPPALRPAVRAAALKTFATGETVVFRGQNLDVADQTILVNISVELLEREAGGRGLATVLFERVPQIVVGPQGPVEESRDATADEPTKDALILQLEEQLRLSQEDLNAAIEQLATSNDGLVSANEELMSVNEELQATNEELETAKEELQTLNEELSTVNQELQFKVDALDHAHSDIENLLNSNAVATLFLDRDLKVKRFTPAVARIFSLIRSDIGRPLQDIRGEIAHAGLLQDARVILETGTQLERELTSLDGSRHFFVRLAPYRGSDFGVAGVVTTFLDITDRRRMEEELREQNEILDLANVLVRDLEDRIVMWNTGATLLYGYSREEALGRSSHDLLCTRFPQPLDSIMSELLLKGTWLGQLVHQTRDARAVAVQSRWRLHRDANGEPVRILETNVDITALESLTAELRESEAKFETMFEVMPLGLALATVPEGTYKVVNREWLRVVGLSRKEAAIGKTSVELGLMRDEAERGHILDMLRRDGRVRNAQTTIFMPSGERRTVRISIDTITVNENRYALSVVEDITDHIRMEAELRNSEKLRAIGTLAGGIAHDFNNLLHGLFGYISLAKAELDPKSSPAAHLSQAEQALKTASGLSSQLLTFSKGGRPERNHLRLQPLIESAVRFATSGSHAEFRLDIAPDLAAVEADEGQISQVIQNIVINAVQAMEEGGVVEVRAYNVAKGEPLPVPLPRAKDHAAISISDSGSGISPECMNRIFDPYFTTKELGNGLGLAVAHSIVRNHGGRIDVASRPGQGSTFTVYLPATDKEEAATSRPVPEPTPAARVLVMDDERLLRDLAARMIGGLGHTVTLARDGGEAVEKYRMALESGTRYDVVILDLTVRGGMGGKKAVERLLAIDPNVKAVVSSGYSDDDAVANHAKYGFCAVLSKPYTLDALRETLARAIGASPAASEPAR